MHRIAPYVFICIGLVASVPARADDPWVAYKGGDGPGKGKKVVLVSGDEEYRSEELCPQLAKILAQRHGFQHTLARQADFRIAHARQPQGRFQVDRPHVRRRLLRICAPGK